MKGQCLGLCLCHASCHTSCHTSCYASATPLPQGPSAWGMGGARSAPALKERWLSRSEPNSMQQTVCCLRYVATGPHQRHPCRTSPSRSAVPLEASNANATIASLEALEDKARSPAPSVAASGGAGMRVRGLSSSGSMYAGAKILGRIARLACNSRRAFGPLRLGPFASWGGARIALGGVPSSGGEGRGGGSESTTRDRGARTSAEAATGLLGREVLDPRSTPTNTYFILTLYLLAPIGAAQRALHRCVDASRPSLRRPHYGAAY